MGVFGGRIHISADVLGSVVSGVPVGEGVGYFGQADCIKVIKSKELK